MRLLYLNVDDEAYPRNRRIRQSLIEEGHEVILLPKTQVNSLFGDTFSLIRSTLVLRNKIDVVFLAEFNIQHATTARIIAARLGARLVIDAFVGLHETAVEDWGVVRAGTWRAGAYRLLDLAGWKFGDAVLVDTAKRGELISGYTNSKIINLPVGAPHWATEDTKASSAHPTNVRSGPLKVLYYGNYVPLHGLEYVRDALALYAGPKLHITFVGDGSRREVFESSLRDHTQYSFEFRPSVQEAELKPLIHAHEVVLGVFGRSEKASNVIPNKVWQGLACGRTVITRDSVALDEIRATLGTNQLIEVDPDDPTDLARVLSEMASNPLSGGSFYEVSEKLDSYVKDQFKILHRMLEDMES